MDIRRQTIIYIDAGLLSIWPLETNVSKFSIKTKVFNHENVSENTICKMAAILVRGGELALHWPVKL